MTDKQHYLADIEKRRKQYHNMKTLIESLPKTFRASLGGVFVEETETLEQS